MDIIDFHTHTFEDSVAPKAVDKLIHSANIMHYYDGTDSSLTASNKQDGIALSIGIPVATRPGQAERINAKSVIKNEHVDESGILFFGAIHPEDENLRDALRGIKNAGFKGIKLHPVFQHVYADDPKYMEILDAASELDLITVIHAGLDHGFPGDERASIKYILKLIDKVHPKKFVLAHMGGMCEWDMVESDLAGADVYLDTAYSIDEVIAFDGNIRPDTPVMSKEQFVRLVKKHGVDRVLFGTDSPWTDRSVALKNIKNSGLSEEDIKKILSTNGRGLLE